MIRRLFFGNGKQERLIACPYCHIMMEASHLRRHMKKNHNDEYIEQEYMNDEFFPGNVDDQEILDLGDRGELDE